MPASWAKRRIPRRLVEEVGHRAVGPEQPRRFFDRAPEDRVDVRGARRWRARLRGRRRRRWRIGSSRRRSPRTGRGHGPRIARRANGRDRRLSAAPTSSVASSADERAPPSRAFDHGPYRSMPTVRRSDRGRAWPQPVRQWRRIDLGIEAERTTKRGRCPMAGRLSTPTMPSSNNWPSSERRSRSAADDKETRS